jgi:hypothetical protein
MSMQRSDIPGTGTTSPIIHLWYAMGLGLIIPYPTGIRYSNQTGGFACWHPELEGMYLPLGNDLDEANVLMGAAVELMVYAVGEKWAGTGAHAGLDVEDADHIDAILARGYLGYAMRVDRTRLRESHEAWVWVELLQDPRYQWVIDGFDPWPSHAILTWPNSD